MAHMAPVLYPLIALTSLAAKNATTTTTSANTTLAPPWPAPSALSFFQSFCYSFTITVLLSIHSTVYTGTILLHSRFERFCSIYLGSLSGLLFLTLLAVLTGKYFH